MTTTPGLLTRINQAAGGLAADLALYSLSAIFALVTALTSTLLPHRAWGAIAAVGYLVAALVVAVQLVLRKPVRRATLTWATWAAVTLLPLVVQAVQRAAGRTDRAQEEVLVVEHMGESLLHTGTPYLSRPEIAGIALDERLLGYRPYQPGMALFGLPRAIAGDHWWTDARVWFALATVGALVVAVTVLLRVRGTDFSLVRALQAATVLPVTSLTLATGGDDIPVLALCLLALALFAAGRHTASGLAVGAAAACKLLAFPVVAVLLVLAVATGHWRRFLPGALGLPLLALLPPLLVNADALIENVLRFPLGHGLVTSPAQSPFPGHLIAQFLPGGRYLAAGLLVAAAAVIGLLLLRRPPRDAGTAALFCGYGLLAAILLMPTTRFGYLLYPAAFLVWAYALRNHTASSAPRHDTALYRQ
ncbi:glycosyltransferase 87 family protein [Actinoplanes rectilineatus]|uniref:glycosyltransferase 87 family protein n=1 Tax=Actinoplanes rectilineatus TaxID=113571 RepID=UPI0005F2C906|nr:glycosyltransferase 87 family protein [Actinoplanes rectilineatus]